MDVSDSGHHSRVRAHSSHTESLLLNLHIRIAEGDRAALESLAECALPLIKRRLQRASASSGAELISDAVEDAILDYAAHPDRFDPMRGVPLEHLLLCSAQRNLLNLLQGERRREIRERKYAESVHRAPCWRKDGAKRTEEFDRSWLLSVTTSEIERRAFELWLNGDHSNRIIACTLGLSHLSDEEQRCEAKRFKDRIVRRLRRKAEKTRALGRE